MREGINHSTPWLFTGVVSSAEVLPHSRAGRSDIRVRIDDCERSSGCVDNIEKIAYSVLLWYETFGSVRRGALSPSASQRWFGTQLRWPRGVLQCFLCVRVTGLPKRTGRSLLPSNASYVIKSTSKHSCTEPFPGRIISSVVVNPKSSPYLDLL